VGFNELRDFYPALLCDNLNAQNLGIAAFALSLDAPPPAAGRGDITPLQLADIFEAPEFRRQVMNALKKAAQDVDRAGFPAVLGLHKHTEVMADLERGLGKPVFEISALPPSVPGRRLYERLKDIFLKAGGRLLIGSKVLGGEIEAGRVTQIRHETVTRPKTLRAEHYVLATGGIYGGGLEATSDGVIHEPIFNLPVAAPSDRAAWFGPELLSPGGRAIHRVGIRVDERFNPLDANGAVIAKNLYVAGNMLADVNWIQGRTGDGVAITSAFKVVEEILE
ncbi:MAG TPA: anaerobic glycerol-3-phosphate dehydrogenase subunit B, partial [Chloroflexi bacterium]|nr:anaerobic glycerol-3-phosphate dehydrogenase subunit B [Chloroflexota bacterium]